MEGKDLQKTEDTQIEVLGKEKLLNYLDTMGITSNLSEAQKEQFVEVAQAFKLNPFKREIHAVSYQNKDGTTTLSVITGYEVYLKRADRTGKLDGWKAGVKQTGSGLEGLVGFVEIYRKDWTRPFYHEVDFKEVAKKNSYGYTQFWKNSPKQQLKKVAISQGFRMCFPDDIGGMPYTSEELPDDMAGRNVTPEAHDDYNDDVKNTDVNVENTGGSKDEPTPKKKTNINDIDDENRAAYKDIMHLINSKGGDGVELFALEEKITNKKKADTIINELEALKSLLFTLNKIADERIQGE